MTYSGKIHKTSYDEFIKFSYEKALKSWDFLGLKKLLSKLLLHKAYQI